MATMTVVTGSSYSNTMLSYEDSTVGLQEETMDSLAALLKLEEVYACRDYMASERKEQCDFAGPEDDDLVHIFLEECAGLVTDTQFATFTYPVDASSPCSGIMSKSPSTVSIQDVKDVGEHQQRQQDRHQQQSESSNSFSSWRQQMFDWACMVVDSFGMDREVVAVSFNILDRYMAYETQQAMSKNSPPITRDDFQLFSMTALYLAVKVLEPYPRKISLQALVDMSRGFYTPQDISITEMDILTALKWHIHPPTARGFCRLYWNVLQVESATSDMQATANTLAEIATAEADFVAVRPSIIGMAAVVHALRLEGRSDVVLRECVHTLHSAMGSAQQAEPANHNNNNKADLTESIQSESMEFIRVYRLLEKLYYS